jgi:hypothetical protein
VSQDMRFRFRVTGFVCRIGFSQEGVLNPG